MLYLGTSDLPIYRFDKIQSTNNLAYLIIDWNERDEVKIPEGANELWEQIQEVWHEKTSNNEAMIRNALVSEVDYLERRLYAISVLIHSITENNKKAFGEELNAWGVKFNAKKTVKSQLKNLNRQVRAAKTKIGLKQSDLEQMSTDEAPMGILKQKIKLERALGLKIDIKTTPVDEWLVLYDELIELSENGKRNTHN